MAWGPGQPFSTQQIRVLLPQEMEVRVKILFTSICHTDLSAWKGQVMPYSTGCKTPLSNFEANLNYEEVSDPEIMVTFPIIDDPDSAAFVAWTTTPWTLPSNLALCVNPSFVYVKVKSNSDGKILVVAESRLSELPVEKPKKVTPNGDVDDKSLPKPKRSTGGKAKNSVVAYEVLDKFPGSSLVGKKYVPLFDYFKDFTETIFRVVADDYEENLVMPVDDDGHFTQRIADFSGRYLKEADKDVINVVKEKGRLVKTGSCTHLYPVCWRSDTPLIYRAVPSWFVAVERLKDKLLQNTKETKWVPNFVKEKRFHREGDSHPSFDLTPAQKLEGKKEYTDDDLDEIREEWANYVANFIYRS